MQGYCPTTFSFVFLARYSRALNYSNFATFSTYIFSQNRESTMFECAMWIFFSNRSSQFIYLFKFYSYVNKSWLAQLIKYGFLAITATTIAITCKWEKNVPIEGQIIDTWWLTGQEFFDQLFYFRLRNIPNLAVYFSIRLL